MMSTKQQGDVPFAELIMVYSSGALTTMYLCSCPIEAKMVALSPKPSWDGYTASPGLRGSEPNGFHMSASTLVSAWR
ncbi:hypothetical protein BR93DRAFT_923457 [Coniochaeta sp. PMI_546]|nr:hypothetical protein BR93DRAFT_923457 [Coniochaeta sp. PMI_546]